MNRTIFNSLINKNSFNKLFITEMGWNNPSNLISFSIEIDEVEYNFQPVAEKSGFQVYSCEVETLPNASECKKIDSKLRNYGYDYICIFTLKNSSHHLWLTPIKTNEKRELVKIEYLQSAQADFLFSKIDDLTFKLTDEVFITDVKQRVQGSFHLNSEKITKDFYAQFRKEHTAFKKHIVGIDDEKNRDWYTSVMLNRLMFCYFVQKKGFLDNDTNYLQNKLQWVKNVRGANQFFGTFYKSFLCILFHDGFNTPQHDNNDFLKTFGRIPYLNGGMFDDHQLEREYKGIDIPDEAFEKLFNFFDKWNWHLDTRLTASGKDINPDVLGYIFEQYINDRAAMGAYYTKEDITEYIGKNCILPFLMDKTAESSPKAFAPEGEVWQLLAESGDRYIFDAVKKGYSPDWQQQIPDYIAQGLNTTDGTGLLERRARWNEKTRADFALPTEIWRETVERLQRCDSLRQKISGGEITAINDFITYNLDIRSFVEDVLRHTCDHDLVAHFYSALQNVTILDPTCGSGAFLFAALNILEPLYEVCIDRMEEFNRQDTNLFTQQLDEIRAKYSSNRQYFIYKSIILRNLYGVDIMVEATEIAKLRLFLKMVAVVEVDKRKPNLGLDPLPDIDFNIKCGNTLVGYATEDELEKALNPRQGELYASEDLKQDIYKEMQLVATAYSSFRSEQLKTYDDNESIKQTKQLLKEKLTKLNNLLNCKMFEATVGSEGDYNAWLASHQPFHWLAEFYQIIKGNGGFDVIIGNPPYVVYTDAKSAYRISNSYKTRECQNLYAFCIERCQHIRTNCGRFGMIVPNSSISASKMKTLQEIATNNRNCWISNYSWRPSKLFEGADMLLAIIINVYSKTSTVYSSIYKKWYNEYRTVLFNMIEYNDVTDIKIQGSIPKLPNMLAKKILCTMKTKSSDRNLIGFVENKSNFRLFYFRAVQYWFKVLNTEPIFEEDGVHMVTGEMKSMYFKDAETCNATISILSSNIFFVHYIIWSSCQVVNSRDFNVNIDFEKFDSQSLNELSNLGIKLQEDYQKNSHIKDRSYSKKGRKFNMRKQHFYIKYSKPLIDEIDKVLAKHYGFTDEELDFIINYDIKYRMGDELGGEE